jgi:hypothetical protein
MMPLPIERSCWGKLDQISQLVGQINGMAYGCRRWNLPALKSLDVELDGLMQGTYCRPAAVGADSKAYNELIDMLINVQLLLSSFGDNEEGYQELAREEVGRAAASASVGEIQGHWLTGLNDIHKWYGGDSNVHTNGHSGTEPIPEAVR